MVKVNVELTLEFLKTLCKVIIHDLELFFATLFHLKLHLVKGKVDNSGNILFMAVALYLIDTLDAVVYLRDECRDRHVFSK